MAALVVTVWLLCSAPALAARAPDPGGDATAGFVAPPGGKWFGFGGIRHGAGLKPVTAARLIAGVRGNAARTVMHWQAIEQRRDLYSPALDRHVELHDALRRRGVELIVVLQYAPAWARDLGAPRNCGDRDACHYPPARSMLGERREFVADVARRLPTATIEVWNAPNFHGQWQSGVDPERYAELLVEADAAAPGRVLAGGLGTTPKENSLTAPEFLDRAYAASPSLKGHTTAVNFHVYPGESLGAGSSFAEVFAGIRAVRAKHEDEDTRLLITETGATTTGPLALDQRRQADLILRAARKILTMPDTAGVLLYTLTDRTELDPGDPERGFGVLGAEPGLLASAIEPKNSYCVLRVAAKQPYEQCPPTVRINRAPPAIVTGRQAEISFSAPGTLTPSFGCALDGGPHQPCTSPKRFGPLAEGPHTISVRVSDLLGRRDPYPSIARFLVDRRDNNRLKLKVRPRKLRARAGSTRRLRVKVKTRGTPVGVERAKVCVKPKKRRLVRGGRSCEQLGPIAAGEPVTTKLAVRLKRRARGKRIPVVVVARAPGADNDRTRARIRVRRR